MMPCPVIHASASAPTACLLLVSAASAAGVADAEEMLHSPVQAKADNDAGERDTHGSALPYFGSIHQKTASSTSAAVEIRAARLPTFGSVPGPPGAPNADCAMVCGPSGCIVAAGTLALRKPGQPLENTLPPMPMPVPNCPGCAPDMTCAPYSL